MIRKAQAVSTSFVKSKSLGPCAEYLPLPLQMHSNLLLQALGPRRLTSMGCINWFPCPWLLVGFGQWGNLARNQREGSGAPFTPSLLQYDCCGLGMSLKLGPQLWSVMPSSWLPLLPLPPAQDRQQRATSPLVICYPCGFLTP